MAQAASALREPTMDEILTSIREIIEENTAQAMQLETVQNRQKISSVNTNVQAEQCSPKPLSVDDAMKALAERIGLAQKLEEKVDAPTAQAPVFQAIERQSEFNNAAARQAEITARQTEVPVFQAIERQSEFNNTAARQAEMAARQTEASARQAEIATKQIEAAARQAEIAIKQAEERLFEREKAAFSQFQTVENAARRATIVTNSLFSEMEKIAISALRPMLSQWLEQRLPVLIERILREEVSKVTQDLR